MSKTLNDLRAALFETLQAVKDNTMDLDRARSINEVGRTLIETAKVEVDYLRVTGGSESGFIEPAIDTDNLPEGLPNGIVGVRRHLLGG